MITQSICFFEKDTVKYFDISDTENTFDYGKDPKILYTNVYDKWHKQTVQIQIRLQLQEQPDQGLHSYAFH